jgi:peptide deformylase
VSTYPIRLFGDPVLKQRSREVEELDGSLDQLVRTMYDTMYEAIGLGLAAPQVGVQKRIFTYDVGDGPHVVINPVVVDTAGEWVYDEGCLSVPGLSFDIVRPQRVVVQGLDLHGAEVVLEDDERLGRVFLHEIDHLDGILVLDRVEPEIRRQALKAIRDQDLLSAGLRPAEGGPRL